ncbi:SigE family RNA polymerase sigma factor [Streptomyces sp. NPDC052721]|uniref:SigE family RNA polymerase sigma factor n=1 Tax=Streptomyces sp. NPDC052721 TaxID=3154955 RepID=UPI00343EA2AE
MNVKDTAAADFEEFVNACSPRLLRFAWLLTGDAHLAEDLLQTALAKVWPKWPRISGEHSEAYVRKTIVHTHASWWQRRWRGEIPYGELPDTAATGSDAFSALHSDHALAQAMRQLPKRQRAVIVLRYFEDMSVEDTAEVLGCSPGTVKSQASRAVRALRKTLLDKEPQAASGQEVNVPTEDERHLRRPSRR